MNNTDKPLEGEIRYARDIGHKGSSKYQWVICPKCTSGLWVRYDRHKNGEKFICETCIKRRDSGFYLNITEPVEGEIRRARDIGLKGWVRHQWHACEDCGFKRWVQYNQLLKGRHRYCKKCGNKYIGVNNRKENSYNWKGGRAVNKMGYVSVAVEPDDPMACMIKSANYVLEHRLVMARHLGRPLTAKEIVHHKNGNKADNRIENLELTTLGQHSLDHSKGYQEGYKKGFSDGRNKLIGDLRAEISLLKEKLKTNGD